MSFDVQNFIDCIKKGAAIAGLDLSPDQIDLLAGHAAQLDLWNRKINLTAIRTARAMAEKHFLDTVCAAPLISPHERIMDMGAGGGFPSIPLKILCPAMAVTMVDSVRKKVSFLNHVVRTLNLDGIAGIHARVEDLACDPAYAQRYGAVISRGFADLEKFVGLAWPMIEPGGCIYAMKGDHGCSEITPALEQKFTITVKEYTLPVDRDLRYLICLTRK